MSEHELIATLHSAPWPIYESDVIARCSELLTAGRSFDYGRGAEIALLEEAFAKIHGRQYCLATNSGTSALYLAYLALGVRPGDEVLVPTYTFSATATPLLLLGALPVLVDSGDEWGNVTIETLSRAAVNKPKGIVVTHLFGAPCNMQQIAAFAAKRGLFLVEDCSHGHGSLEQGRPIGTWGDAAVYSVGARKLVSGGMGGILMTNDSDAYDIAVLASASQQRSDISTANPMYRRFVSTGLGGNLRMSPIAAILAHSHLRRLEELVAVKRARVERLVTALSELPGLSRLAERQGTDAGARHGVHVRYDPRVFGLDRATILATLQSHGLRVRGPQTEPLHRTYLFAESAQLPFTITSHQPDFSVAHSARTQFPNADRLADAWVGLPADYLCGPQGDALVDYYVKKWRDVWTDLERSQ